MEEERERLRSRLDTVEDRYEAPRFVQGWIMKRALQELAQHELCLWTITDAGSSWWVVRVNLRGRRHALDSLRGLEPLFADHWRRRELIEEYPR